MGRAAGILTQLLGSICQHMHASYTITITIRSCYLYLTVDGTGQRQQGRLRLSLSAGPQIYHGTVAAAFLCNAEDASPYPPCHHPFPASANARQPVTADTFHCCWLLLIDSLVYDAFMHDIT